MSLPSVALYISFLLIVLVLVKPVGGYMARVFAGERTWLDPALRPVERFIYALCGIDAEREMDRRQYTIAFVIFSLVGTLLLFAILRLQQFFPFYDPVHLVTPLTPDLAINTAISFATTTTWQAYAGETTMSYASQLGGLVVQNFLAGAGGLAVGIALSAGSRANTPRRWGTSGWTWCAGCCGYSCQRPCWSAWCWCGRACR
jgi:potassium-transporting ATPase potassium-binding subunit